MFFTPMGFLLDKYFLFCSLSWGWQILVVNVTVSLLVVRYEQDGCSFVINCLNMPSLAVQPFLCVCKILNNYSHFVSSMTVSYFMFLKTYFRMEKFGSLTKVLFNIFSGVDQVCSQGRCIKVLEKTYNLYTSARPEIEGSSGQ